MRRGPGLFGIIYLVIGLIVAANRGYLASLTTLGSIIEALLAILLWPLVFIGVSFQGLFA